MTMYPLNMRIIVTSLGFRWIGDDEGGWQVDFMRKIRNILIEAAALGLLLVAVTLPAGASTTHAKFIKAVHAWVPSTKHLKNKNLVAAGEVVCHALEQYPGHGQEAWQPVEEAFGTFQNNPQVANVFTQAQMNEIFGESVLFLCPSYEQGIRQFNQIQGDGSANPNWIPTSKTPPPAPPRIVPVPAVVNTAAVYQEATELSPALSSDSAARIVGLANDVCDDFAKSLTPSDLASQAPVTGLASEVSSRLHGPNADDVSSTAEATTIIVDATNFICPQYEYVGAVAFLFPTITTATTAEAEADGLCSVEAGALVPGESAPACS
jgi:hypothetical protein